MILQRLLLENFRQFDGSNTVEFAASEKKNVTLIHGFNGSGKTALLNAFIWCLYGVTTKDFEDPDRLASEAAMVASAEGARVIVKVRMNFTNRDGTYVVERTQGFLKRGSDQIPEEPKLSLLLQKPGGTELAPITTAQQGRIHTILSQHLYRFFFFNGEQVEWLASSDAYEEVEEGLKSLLDIKIYERSIHHLRDNVSRDLAAMLKQHGGAEMQETISQLQNLTEKAVELADQEKSLAADISDLEEQKEDFERKQRELESVRSLIESRDALRKNLTLLHRTLGERTAELARSVSDHGYLAMATDELQATHDMVDAARQRGELPAKIKPQFVDDLIDRAKCICGRPLSEHDSTEVAALRDWQKNTGLAEHEEAINYVSAAVRSLEVRRDNYLATVADLQGKRSSLKSQIAEVQDQIDEIQAKLGNDDAGYEAVSLAEMITKLSNDLIDRKADKATVQRQLMDNKEQQKELERTLEKLKATDQKGELIKRQREAVERVATVLEGIYNLRKDDTRQDLSSRIERLWKDAAIKDYSASLNEQFQLKLTKRVGGVEQLVRGASTGEKQVLALAFVGSLVEKARENMQESRPGDVDAGRGGQYPLVMDSPFGSLEDDYRAKVAHWIPKLASQVVIFVSKTQWREEVEREIRPRVGKEYVLELHSMKEGSSRSIDILNQSFEYVVETTDPFERTKIQEVKP